MQNNQDGNHIAAGKQSPKPSALNLNQRPIRRRSSSSASLLSLSPCRPTTPTHRLIETAVGVREVQKNIGRAKVLCENPKSLMIVTKLNDIRLIELTRELVCWIIDTIGVSKDGYPVEIYVGEELRTHKQFKYSKLIKSSPKYSSQLKFWNAEFCKNSADLIDFIITLGGDGTVLYTSWLFQDIVPPVIPFHLGSLGFLTVYDFSKYKTSLLYIFQHGVRVNLRMRFTCEVYRQVRTASKHPHAKGARKRNSLKSDQSAPNQREPVSKSNSRTVSDSESKPDFRRVKSVESMKQLANSVKRLNLSFENLKMDSTDSASPVSIPSTVSPHAASDIANEQETENNGIDYFGLTVPKVETHSIISNGAPNGLKFTASPIDVESIQGSQAPEGDGTKENVNGDTHDGYVYSRLDRRADSVSSFHCEPGKNRVDEETLSVTDASTSSTPRASNFQSARSHSRARISTSSVSSGSSIASSSSLGTRSQNINETQQRKRDRRKRQKTKYTIESFEVLNELVVDRGPSAYMSELEVFGDERHLTTVQADGLVISTPTGSTAYSLSAGGSIVHPEVSALLVTPICPHTLSFRPMLLPDWIELKVCVPACSRNTAWASFDGRHRIELKQGDFIAITASRFPFPTVCLGDQSSDWFNSLIRCLKWNERQRQKPFHMGHTNGRNGMVESDEETEDEVDLGGEEGEDVDDWECDIEGESDDDNGDEEDDGRTGRDRRNIVRLKG
ncbi:ATP-NAD kinase-like domain-containing protein [Paraphysoderma sedebokerense]|nr:ATP-NAD kinase-like domain-containing protein [Paraphysoderma sedebokerense]